MQVQMPLFCSIFTSKSGKINKKFKFFPPKHRVFFSRNEKRYFKKWKLHQSLKSPWTKNIGRIMWSPKNLRRAAGTYFLTLPIDSLGDVDVIYFELLTILSLQNEIFIDKKLRRILFLSLSRNKFINKVIKNKSYCVSTKSNGLIVIHFYL